MFAHTLTDCKNSTNKKKLLQRAKKTVHQAEIAAVAAAATQASKKARTEPESITGIEFNLGGDPQEDNIEQQSLVQEARHRLLEAQKTIYAHKTSKRKTRVGKVVAGMSIKRGCQCSFVAKQLLIDESLCTIHFHCMDHVNKEGTPCHGLEFGGQRAGLSGRLSQATKDWIQASLRSGKSPAQVMADHKLEVMRCAKLNLPATRDTFVLPHDIGNIAKALAKELWEKHPRDALSVRMWTLENQESWYHYNEYGNIQLNDPPPNDDPFCLAIQTDWQLEMMVRHGHQRALSMDATFGTNEPKVKFTHHPVLHCTLELLKELFF